MEQGVVRPQLVLRQPCPRPIPASHSYPAHTPCPLPRHLPPAAAAVAARTHARSPARVCARARTATQTLAAGAQRARMRLIPMKRGTRGLTGEGEPGVGGTRSSEQGARMRAPCSLLHCFAASVLACEPLFRLPGSHLQSEGSQAGRPRCTARQRGTRLSPRALPPSGMSRGEPPPALAQTRTSPPSLGQQATADLRTPRARARALRPPSLGLWSGGAAGRGCGRSAPCILQAKHDSLPPCRPCLPQSARRPSHRHRASRGTAGRVPPAVLFVVVGTSAAALCGTSGGGGALRRFLRLASTRAAPLGHGPRSCCCATAGADRVMCWETSLSDAGHLVTCPPPHDLTVIRGCP